MAEHQNELNNMGLESNMGMIDLLGGGIRLTVLGFAFFFGIQYGYDEIVEFAYPYLPPSLVVSIQIWSIIGFIFPGFIFLLLCTKGKVLGTPNVVKLPVLIRILLTIGGITACVGFLGIRTGVMILLNLYKPPISSDLSESTPIKSSDAIKSYRLYLGAGGSSTFIWGLFFFAITEMIEVLPIDSVPQVNQLMITLLTAWIFLGMIIPGLIFIYLAIWINPEQSENVRKYQLQMIRLLGPLACIGVFGFSIGLKLLLNRWMIQTNVSDGSKVN